MEGEIQRVAFDEAFAHGLHDVEILLESAVGVLRAAESELGVEDIGVVARTGGIFFGGLGITCQAGCVPDRPVVVGIFKRVAGSCGDVVIRDVTEFHVVPKATVPLLFRGRDHGFQSPLPVNVQPLGNGVGQDGHCMVAAHAPVFVGHVAPDRQHVQDVLVVMGQHGLDHVTVTVRLEQCEERMLCPVGVPKGENSVVRESFSLVDLMVEPAIGSVHVHVDRWVDHRVVERGVEHLLLVICAFDVNLGQFLFPGLFSCGSYLVERLSFRFSKEILQRSGGSGR